MFVWLGTILIGLLLIWLLFRLGVGTWGAGVIALLLLRGRIRKFLFGYLKRTLNPQDLGSSGTHYGNEQASEIDTKTLSMSLDHQTGEIDGWIKNGRFSGARLSSLSVQQVVQLRRESEREDPEACTLLEAYLDRIEPDWRDRFDSESEKTNRAGGATSPMSVEEAYRVLGIEPPARADEIKAAHHRLMMKMHPDQGGSDFLASKINQAKELLLRDL